MGRNNFSDILYTIMALRYKFDQSCCQPAGRQLMYYINSLVQHQRNGQQVYLESSAILACLVHLSDLPQNVILK